MSEQPQELGPFLRASRERCGLSLRGVERSAGVSNAYLSQLESGKIRQPSPLVLHKLAGLYEVPYSLVLERAGYPTAGAGTGGPVVVHSRLGPINGDEEQALEQYLQFLRSRHPPGGTG